MSEPYLEAKFKAQYEDLSPNERKVLLVFPTYAQISLDKLMKKTKLSEESLIDLLEEMHWKEWVTQGLEEGTTRLTVAGTIAKSTAELGKNLRWK